MNHDALNTATDEYLCPRHGRGCFCHPAAEPNDSNPEAMYDRLAALTAELSDEQRRELAELLLSGDVDAELLAFVLRDQATVESDGQWGVGMVPELIAHEHAVTNSLAGMGLSREPLAPEAIETVESAPKHRTLGEMDDDTWGGVEAGWELLLFGVWRDFDTVGHAVIAHPGNHCLPIRPRAPKYRDDTRLLQCCGVARLIGHRAGCAEAS